MIFGRLGVEKTGGLGSDGGVEDEFGGVGVGGGLDVDDFEGHEQLRRHTAETAVAHKRFSVTEFTVGAMGSGSRLQIKAFWELWSKALAWLLKSGT